MSCKFAGLVVTMALWAGVATTGEWIRNRPHPQPVWYLLLYRLMDAHGFPYDVSNGCGIGSFRLPRPSGMMISTTAMRPF